ncbi:hypothetical protein VTN02DRAFT_4075 [Thermoascus thermophilus]
MGTFTPSGANIPPAIKELNESSVETLLQSLVVSYFHPRTRENLALRQALAYFFPVYCHSRLANTQHMRKIAVPVVRAVLNAAEEFFALEAEEDSDGDIDETAGQKEIKALMAGVVGMLVEWTDERRVVGLGGEKVLVGAPVTSTACGSVHLALVKDVLERVLGISTGTTKCSKEEQKLLLSILGKIYIAPPAPPAPPSRASSRVPEGDEGFRSSTRSNRAAEVDPENVRLAEEVKELLDQAMEDGVAADAAGRNAIVKVKNAVLKLLAAAAGTLRETDLGRYERASTVASDDFADGRRSMAGSVRGSVEPTIEGRDRSVEQLSVIGEEDEDVHDESGGTIIKAEAED